MNLRDGNSADLIQARQEAERQYEETMSAWPLIRKLESESLGHLRENNFAARIKRAFQGELKP